MNASHDPLFDAYAHTTAGHPHLVEHLELMYRAHLAEALEQRRAEGKPANTVEGAFRTAPLAHFLKWAAAYLNENRPVENFFVDMNHGVVLSDNSRLVISPGTDVAGTMQDSGAVPVTHGRGPSGHDRPARGSGAVDIR